MKRRHVVLGSLSVGLCAVTARRGLADTLPPRVLLAAGPSGEAISRWADACSLALQPGFPGNPSFVTRSDGGLDGVTGANRFDVLVVPDGRTAAVLPGLALMAWLTGDSRVHFDPTRWAPIMAGRNSGVLVVRASAPISPASLRAMAPLRVAADTPQSNDLAALLALERMGVHTAPVFGLHSTAAKTDAFVNGKADAVFLSGEGVPEDIAPLSANGGVPVFTLGMLDASGAVQPDPAFPNLPEAIAFSGIPASPLDDSYHAAAAAARLDFIMVLPKLTDPGVVAQWRGAAEMAITAPAMQAAASASSIALTPSQIAAAELMALMGGQSHQAGLQAFLVQRFGWQPG